MKVLNVIMRLDERGCGTTERAIELARALQKQGIKVATLSLDCYLTEERRHALSDLTLTILPSINDRFFIPAPLFFKMATVVKQCDIIHLMNHWTVLNAIIYILARIYKKPYVFCPAGALNIYGRSKYLKKIYTLLIGRSIVKHADALIVTSENEKTHFTAYYYDTSKLWILPIGITPMKPLENSQNIHSTLSIPKKPFILFLGRLNLIKGPDILLSAFSEIQMIHPNLQLIYAGNDEGMRDELNIIIHNKKINNTHFIPFINNKMHVFALLKASECLVISSRSEALSTVVLEAGLSETAVVATDQCGLEDVQNHNAVVLSTVTAHDLAIKVQNVIENDDLRQSLGINLNEYVLKNYSWDTLTPRYIKLFEDILASRTLTSSIPI